MEWKGRGGGGGDGAELVIYHVHFSAIYSYHPSLKIAQPPLANALMKFSINSEVAWAGAEAKAVRGFYTAHTHSAYKEDTSFTATVCPYSPAATN